MLSLEPRCANNICQNSAVMRVSWSETMKVERPFETVDVVNVELS